MVHNAYQRMKGKLLLRDIFTSVLLLISFSLCFLLIMNGLNIVHKVNMASNAKKGNAYKITIPMECVPLDEWTNVPREVNPSETINNLNIKKGNVELQGFGVQCGASFTQRGSTVYLKWMEDIPVALRSGRYPTPAELKEGRLITLIGSGLTEYAEMIDGAKSLKIEGEWYQVIGVLEDDTSSNVDERILLFYDCMHDALQYKFVEQLTSIQHEDALQYATNQTDAEESIEAFYQWMETHLEADYRSIEETFDGTDNETGEMLAKMNQRIVQVLLAFGLVNCIVISNIWIKKRKKEFAIRKALGGSMFHIGGMVLGELLRLAIGSMCISLIIQEIYQQLGQNVELSGIHVFRDVIYLLLGMLGCVLATLLVPMIQIAKISPIKEIRR